MALSNRIKYDAPSDDAIVWKYPSEEITLGAQLIVNQSQEAVFFKGGKALDTFGPGTHTLSTGNLPLLGKLINLPFGGKTPFTAEIWYTHKTVKRDFKWGTKGPLQLIDPVYHYPVSVRAFGQWGMRILDSRSFITQIVGTQTTSAGKDYFGSERVQEYFTGEIIQRLSDAIAKYITQKNVSIFQISAYLNDLSGFIADDIRPEFDRFGIEIVNFNLENVNIPAEEQEKFQDILGKRMEIDQISQAQVGQAYTTMRSFDTMEKAAENEGGGAGQLMGAGLGLGAGLAAGTPIGQQIGSAMNVQPTQTPAQDDPMAKLQKLKQMFDNDLITQDEYEQKKKQVLDSM